MNENGPHHAPASPPRSVHQARPGVPVAARPIAAKAGGKIESAPLMRTSDMAHEHQAEDAGVAGESAPAQDASATAYEQTAQFAEAMEDAVSRVVKGQEGAVRLILVAMLVRGHVLLEGNPGTAKTLLARTMARLCSLHFRRIQFTPDLMPSDVTGTSIFRPDRGEFEFREGPIFTQLLLADEINRAPARTQAALLQAMQERIVSADGMDYPIDDIFCVIATQNPLESEGTYPLPEAELDRFLFKLDIAYPDEPTELDVLMEHGAAASGDELSALDTGHLLDPEHLMALRELVYQVEVAQDIAQYALQIVRATREHPFLRAGASTRAGVMLLRGARALAATYGRDFVTPDDVRELAAPALRHRLYRSASAELEGVSTDTVIADIVGRIPVPR